MFSQRMILLIILIGSLICTVTADPVISFDPATITMAPGSTAQVTIRLSEAPQGLAGYEFTVDTPSSIATVSGVIFPSWATLNRKSGTPSSLRLSGVDLNKLVESGLTNIELATITVTGTGTGSGQISISGLQMDADGGATLAPSLGTLNMQVGSVAAATTTTPITTVTTATPVTTVTTTATTSPTPTLVLGGEVKAVATLNHNEDGQITATTKTVSTESSSQAYSITISEGTKALNSVGNPLGAVYIAEVPADQYTPPPSTQYSAIKEVVQCGPEGATFDTPATLSFTLTEVEWADALSQANGNVNSIIIMYFDPRTNTWSHIPTIVNPETRTLIGSISHFSTYGVFIEKESGSPTATDTLSPTIPSNASLFSGNPIASNTISQTTVQVTQSQLSQQTSTPFSGISQPVLLVGLIITGFCITGLFLLRPKKP